jgi:hypothetical protein
MKLHHLLLLVAFLTLLPACQAAGATQPQIEQQVIDPPTLPDLGAAPELKNEVWLNSETPLRLADLSGKVVLLDMWTYG